MIGLLPAEVKRQVLRKGSFFGAMGWVGIFGVGTLIWAFFASSPTAETAIVNGGGLLVFAATLAGIVVGATAGAYDVNQGTMRYLVMTGRPRWQLVCVRVLALPVTMALIALPGMLFVLAAGLVAGGTAPEPDAYLDLFYGPWMSAVLFGWLSLTIGTFLKSVGVAIAVSVVANFAGLLIAGVIYENVSETLANSFFPIVAAVAIDRQADTGPDGTLSLETSLIVLAVWLIALIAAANARVYRAEY